MTTDQLLAVLSEDAVRLGAAPISRRILRDWVDEGLITVRKAEGRRRGLNPTWHFSENDTRWARRIVELKAANIHRVAELRLHLWITDDAYPIGKIAGALRSEFKRLMHRHRRSLRFKYDHRDRPQLSKGEQEKFIKQLPPLDEDLTKANFGLSPEQTLQIASELLWGNDSNDRSHKVSEGADAVLAQFNMDNLSGVFGASDETDESGEEQLTHIQNDDLRKARSRLIEFKSRLHARKSLLSGTSDEQVNAKMIAVCKAIWSFETTEWNISTLVAFAVQALRARKGKTPAPETP